MKKLLFIILLSFLFLANVSSLPIIRSRLGGNDIDWSISGTNIYHPENPTIQAGTAIWNGKPANNGQLFLAYPESYGGGHTPLLFVQIIGSTNKNVSYSASPLFSGLLIYWQTTDNTTKEYIDFQWIAIGEK